MKREEARQEQIRQLKKPQGQGSQTLYKSTVTSHQQFMESTASSINKSLFEFSRVSHMKPSTSFSLKDELSSTRAFHSLKHLQQSQKSITPVRKCQVNKENCDMSYKQQQQHASRLMNEKKAFQVSNMLTSGLNATMIVQRSPQKVQVNPQSNILKQTQSSKSKRNFR